MKIAIVPGSFDPMTLGHVDIVEYAAQKYDRVIVAVMNNEQKQYALLPNERLEVARLSVAHVASAEVIFDDGMLIELYDRVGACAVCKGYRDEADLSYEQRMAEWNAAHNPSFYTELIASDPAHASLSSTQVRECLQAGKDVTDLIHPNAREYLLKLWRSKNEA